MSNMSYCRFENTLADLEDCQDNFENIESIDEAQAAIDLYRLCATILNSVSLAELEDRLDTLTCQETEDEDEDEDEK